MSADLHIEIPEGAEDDEDVQRLFDLIAAGLEFESLLLRVGRAAEPAALLVHDPAVRGRQP